MFRIAGEAVLFDHEVVQLVPKKLGALLTSMPVVDAKEAAFWPGFVFPVLWFGDIEDDRHSVFVVVPDQTLVGDGGIRPHDPVPLDGAFCRFLVRYDNPGTRLQRQLLGL